MNPATISLFTFVLSSLSLIMLYNRWFVLSPIMYLIIATVLLFFYVAIKKVHERNKKADKLNIFGLSLFGVAMFSSFIYRNWKLTNLISETNMMKFVLIVFTLLIAYFNIIYIRAEQSYKKKRTNQRIKEEPKKGYMEQLKEGLGKKEKNPNEITLSIGISAESEEK